MSLHLKLLDIDHPLTFEASKLRQIEAHGLIYLSAPQSKEDMKRLLGFVQFLSRYLPSLSTVDAPLREFEKADMLFHWDLPLKESFEKIKKFVSEAPVLQYYNVSKPAKVVYYVGN